MPLIIPFQKDWPGVVTENHKLISVGHGKSGSTVIARIRGRSCLLRWWCFFSWREKSVPSFAGFRLVFNGLAGNGRNPDQDIAVGALQFATGKLFVNLQSSFAMWTGEFEFAHGS